MVIGKINKHLGRQIKKKREKIRKLAKSVIKEGISLQILKVLQENIVIL